MTISELLHISPWDQRERLTVEELQDACDFAEAALAQAQKNRE